MSGSLLLVIWGVDFCFIIFCGVGGWGCLALGFLGDKFWGFFKVFSKYFFTFFGHFFLFLPWNFINICSTFTHSFTQFFCALLGSVSVGWCAFFVFGHRHSGY